MNIGWNVGDKIMAGLTVIFCVTTAAWFTLPTNFFIRQVSLEVDGGQVRFVRELPFGRVTAQWQSEITLLDGFECNSGEWRIAQYQPVAGNTVRYDLGDWAAPCLAAGPPFYLTTTRRALLFGVIPLRASVTRTDVEGEVPAAVILVVPEE